VAQAGKGPTSLSLPRLDALLSGGLRRATLTELVGAPSTGKTTLCLAAAAAAAARGATVFFLHTGAAFPAPRLAALAAAALGEPPQRAGGGGGLSPALEAALERVTVAPAADARSAVAALDAHLAAGHRPALIVLDSAATALDADLGGGPAGAGVAHALARSLKRAAAFLPAAALATVHELRPAGGRSPTPALGRGWRPQAGARVALARAPARAAPRARAAVVLAGPGSGGAAVFELPWS
jgi:RecA/RadA recombinase